MTNKILIAITTANNLEYTIKCINSIDRSKYTIMVFDDCSDDDTYQWCVDNNIPIYKNSTPKGLTTLWNRAYVEFINSSFTHLVFSNNDVIYGKSSIDNMISCLEENNLLVVGPLSNKPGANHRQHISNYIIDSFNVDDPVNISKIEENLEFNTFSHINRINGFCFMVNRKIQKYANTVDGLFPPQFINIGNEDWLCDEINRVEQNKIGICSSSFVFHYKAVTTRHCGPNRDVLWNQTSLSNKNKNLRMNVIRNTDSSVKQNVLCMVDKAMGLGDGVMLLSTVLELSKKYNVRVMGTESVNNILKLVQSPSLKVFSVNDQGSFYTNDHYRAYNLIYWDIRNSLRQFPYHSINMIRYYADLELFNKENKKELPDIPVPHDAMTKMELFISSLPKPIIITQPFISYWNKMIDVDKYLKIVEQCSKIGTVIQIGGNVSPHMISPYGINLIGKTSIEQSLALLKHSDLLISCDSFLQHAAAHVKTPSVVMWCGTSPEEFGYPFFSNIAHPEIAFCQKKCARPLRWLYDYDYTDKSQWNSRSENGWICPSKLCQRVITVEEVIEAVKKELSIGRDRDWSFYDIVL